MNKDYSICLIINNALIYFSGGYLWSRNSQRHTGVGAQMGVWASRSGKALVEWGRSTEVIRPVFIL